MRVVQVNVKIPEPVWGRLATRADDLGVDVARLLADAVENLVPQPSTDRVVVLARSGLSDKEIARLLGLTNKQVSYRRRAGGVPANRWSSRRYVKDVHDEQIAVLESKEKTHG